MVRLSSVLFTVLLFASCAAPVAIINTSDEIDAVQICTSYAIEATEEYQWEIEQALQEFIINHNISDSKIKVKGCDNLYGAQTIHFIFEQPVYVGKEQNLVATLGNLAGFALPIFMASLGSEMIVGFYFWPDTQANVRVNISEDIVGPLGPEFPVVLKSPGYFKSFEKQNIDQGRNFYNTLEFWFSNVEKQYAYEQKKLAKQ